MNVLLIGATGFSGKEILKELLHQGYNVTATTRNASSIGLKDPKLTVLEGNVLDSLFIRNALKKQNAVINALGIGGKGDGKPNTLISDATEILVSEMERSNTTRLIAMSNVGAGNSKNFHPLIFRKIILPFFMKWLKVIIDDKNKMELKIIKSPLDWTIIRCPNITDKPPKNNINATLDGKGLKLSITNRDLAVFMVSQLQNTEFIQEAPSISN